MSAVTDAERAALRQTLIAEWRDDYSVTSVVDALVNTVAAIKAEAGRAALLNLADDIDPNGYGWTSIRDADRFKQRLRDRADRIGGVR